MRSIYSESDIMLGFSPWHRVVIASDLNGLVLVQYPDPTAIFSPICVIFSPFLGQTGLIFSPMASYF